MVNWYWIVWECGIYFKVLQIMHSVYQNKHVINQMLMLQQAKDEEGIFVYLAITMIQNLRRHWNYLFCSQDRIVCKSTVYTAMIHLSYLSNCTWNLSVDYSAWVNWFMPWPWNLPFEFKSDMIRLGDFHCLMSYMSTIGKIWASGGCRDFIAD